MARPARRNGMTFRHIYRHYVPGSKWKRRKGRWRRWGPADPNKRAARREEAIRDAS
jgi:hypothetical protein